jgi:hypothetical protein
MSAPAFTSESAPFPRSLFVASCCGQGCLCDADLHVDVTVFGSVMPSRKCSNVDCMLPDDGHMTDTCCGNNIRGGEEELLR